MAHDISEVVVDGVNVVEAMYANKPAWHGLGRIFDADGSEAPDSMTALRLAHLDWTVRKVRACYDVRELSMEAGADPFPCWEDGEARTVRSAPDRFLTVRTDTGDVLGSVGNDYSIVQNREAFSFLDGLLEDGQLRYESAFALAGGRRVCLLARMPGIEKVADGDVMLSYLLLRTAHDGTSSLVLTPTKIRVVCANTEAYAIGQARSAGTMISLRHSGDMSAKLRQAGALLAQYNQEFTGYVESARLLVDRRYNAEACREYIAKLFPAPEEETGKAFTNWQKRVDRVRNSFRVPANQIPAIRGTWWQLFQAVSEYAERGMTYRGERKAENRLISLVDGQASMLKRDAFKLALEMSA